MIQLKISACMLVLFTLYHVLRWVRRRPEQFSPSLKVVQHRDQQLPSVSFLVPAWNAADSIPGFVTSFLKLAIPNKQLILCAGGNDGSFDISKRYENDRIIVLEQPKGMGKQKALELSLPYATGEVIFLTDIDCDLKDDTVSGLVSALSKTHPVSTGNIRPLEGQRNNPLVVLQWAIRNASSPKEISLTNGLLGANTAILRSVLDAIGGFTKEAPSGTDYTLAKELIRCGYKILYIPNCEMSTEFPASLPSYVQKQSRWLRNVLVIAPRYNAWREVFCVLVTISLPIVYFVLLLLGFLLPLSWTLMILMLLHSTINRIRHVHSMNQKVHMWMPLVLIFGDLYAACRAGYQGLRQRYAW